MTDTKASYRVKIGWEPVPANAFFLDGSQLDTSDILTSQYSSSLNYITFDLTRFGNDDTFTGPYDSIYSDVSSYTKSISYKRGRDNNLSDFSAGEATVVLNDPQSIFSPLNTSSPLYPNVLPGRSLLIESVKDGVVEGQFFGFVRSIEHNPELNARETKVHAQDFFLYLSRAKPVIAATGETTVGSAIEKILLALEWSDPRYISLETGDTIPDFSADGSKTALNLIEELLEVDRGEFFVSRRGIVTYNERQSRHKRTPVFTLEDIAAEATSATDLTNVRNRVTVKNNASGEGAVVISQESRDDLSIANYGYSDYSTISSDYIVSEAQAKNLGEWIVSQAKDPSPPLRDLEFTANISSSLLDTALTVELGDRITVVDSALKTNSDFYVEGISTQISAGAVHKTSINLSKTSSNSPLRFSDGFTLNSSKLDSAGELLDSPVLYSRVRQNGFFGSPTSDSSPYDEIYTRDDVFFY